MIRFSFQIIHGCMILSFFGWLLVDSTGTTVDSTASLFNHHRLTDNAVMGINSRFCPDIDEISQRLTIGSFMKHMYCDWIESFFIPYHRLWAPSSS